MFLIYCTLITNTKINNYFITRKFFHAKFGFLPIRARKELRHSCGISALNYYRTPIIYKVLPSLHFDVELNRDIQNLQLKSTCWYLYLDNLAHLLAKQCLGDRGADGELTLAEVSLVLRYNGVLHLALNVVV